MDLYSWMIVACALTGFPLTALGMLLAIKRQAANCLLAALLTTVTATLLGLFISPVAAPLWESYDSASMLLCFIVWQAICLAIAVGFLQKTSGSEIAWRSRIPIVAAIAAGNLAGILLCPYLPGSPNTQLSATRTEEERLSFFSRMLLFNPGNTRALYERGKSYGNLGNQEQAITDLTRALAADSPMHLQILYQRGRVFLADKQYDKAVKDLDAYLKSAPQGETRTAALDARGQAHRALNQNEKAIADFSAALSESDLPETRLRRALAAMAVEKQELARDDLDRVIAKTKKLDLKARAYFIRAELGERQGRLRAAIGDLSTLFNLVISSREPMLVELRKATYRKMKALTRKLEGESPGS